MLYSFDDDPGRAMESFASCDPSEWPAEVTEALGIGMWLDRHGYFSESMFLCG